MIRWEYKRISLNVADIRFELNKLGYEGWEVVTTDNTGTSFLLKRPIDDTLRKNDTTDL